MQNITKVFSSLFLTLLLSFALTLQTKAVNCNAHFIHYPNTHNLDSVHFYPTVTTGTSYYWNFGDGSPSGTSMSPWHLYASAGTYYVCLYINDSGTVCTWCDSVKVTGHTLTHPCNAAFSHYALINPDSVHFYSSNSAITSQSWNFGDGSAVSTASSPWHLYASLGSYVVCHTVNDSGTYCTSCDTIKTVVVNCNSHFTHYANTHNADSIHFSPAVNNAISYYWNFGDGSPSSIVSSPWHQYAHSGTYHVCLYVNDSGTMCTWCDSVKVLGNAVHCNAHFIHYPNTHNADSIHFYPNITTGTSYYWSFGDGTTSSTATSPWHQYASAGTYYACLYINDSGTTCSWCDSVKVLGNNVIHCNAHFSHYANSHNADSIHFYPNITTGTSYYWSFGDGTTSSTATSPWHQYVSAGTYHVCLYINDSGTTCSWCDSAKVLGTVNCNAHFIHYPNTHNADSVHFYPTTTSGSYYYWNFGDGTSSTNAAPWHLYAPGTYIACLTINTSGVYCTQCDTIIVTGSALPCNAHFTHYSLSSNADSIHFVPSVTGTNTYYWYFGDGTHSTNHAPWHVYSAPGHYYVCLYVNGTSCHWCDSVIINAITPPCNTHFSHYTLNNQDSVHFYPTGTVAASYYWSFGDGTYSSTQYPWHQYAAAGRYYVCMRATTSTSSYCYWCDSVTVVGNPPPPCNSSYAYYCLGNPDSLHFYAYSGLGTNYWDFGDGTTSTSQYPWHYYSALGTYNVCHTTNNNGVYCTSCDSVTLGGTYYVFYRVNAGTGSDTFQFAPSSATGINTMMQNYGMVKLYPNPSNEKVTIAISNLSNTASMRLYDSYGRTVYNMDDLKDGNFTINTKNLLAGNYFYLINSNNQIIAKGQLMIVH